MTQDLDATSPLNAALAQRLQPMAEHYAATPTSLALVALLHSGLVTVPVVGCRTTAQLEASW